ncbi:hypothetical protein AZE42_08980 [Rhizopogon vesiculosus]|uniref:DUF6533 domain-containing protein n=1 Tax=Rhizopogon vesiculosus TaxID=180088 RepID=A0A1J8PXX9_9AGAM|nr:hypothetical protein AZE42_08980 [Rhizopogon vesiculosus]
MALHVVLDSEMSEKYFRVASISIALYDYVITLPAEWRFYRSQSSIFHLSLACVLFILIRYGSILVMTLGNYGIFSTGFTEETCRHYHLAPICFKVIQTMISQVILGVRTFNIARRDRRIGIALVLLFFVSLEWFTNLFHRIQPTAVVVNGNCTTANAGKVLTAWLYYLTSMVYDLVVLIISAVYLLRYNPVSSGLGRLIRVQVPSACAGAPFDQNLPPASNIFNIVLYHTSDIETQSAGVSMGFAVTWIMSQRILIHLRELSELETRRVDNAVVPRPAQTQRDGLSPVRSRFDSKTPIDPESAPPTSPDHAYTSDLELDTRKLSVSEKYMDGSQYSRDFARNEQDAAVLLLKSSTASDARRSPSMNSWIGEGPQRSLPYVNPEPALCTEVAKLGVNRPFEFEAVKSAKDSTPVPSLHPSTSSFDDLQKALKHALQVTPNDQRTAKAKVSAPRLVILVSTCS